jgi:hypothetical protein
MCEGGKTPGMAVEARRASATRPREILTSAPVITSVAITCSGTVESSIRSRQCERG